VTDPVRSRVLTRQARFIQPRFQSEVQRWAVSVVERAAETALISLNRSLGGRARKILLFVLTGAGGLTEAVPCRRPRLACGSQALCVAAHSPRHCKARQTRIHFDSEGSKPFPPPVPPLKRPSITLQT